MTRSSTWASPANAAITIIYIDGQYRGLYNTAERSGRYGASYFGGNKEEHDTIAILRPGHHFDGCGSMAAGLAPEPAKAGLI
jgi:hypothetical protein